MSKFDETKERLERSYDPERDLFDGPIQMNYIDNWLLDLIIKLDEQIQALTERVDFLEVQHYSTSNYD